MTEQMKFQQWCILDIMGHQRFAGLVTEETVAGAAFLRIDIPATGKQVAFTKLFSPSSVYSITPTTEELAKAIASSINNVPIAVYDLPEEMQAKLRSLPTPVPRLPEMDDYDDSEPSFDSDRTPDIAAVKENIAKADETNRKVRENQSYDKLAKEVKDSRGQWQSLTDRLSAIAEERADEVANADWPIEGMELQEDGLVWNGLPFEQASTSQRIMASVAVGMKLNPELRLLVCEHGSDLDVDTMAALDEVLKASDFQCVVEIVTRSPYDEQRCAVVIEDGRVKGIDDDEQDEDLQ